MFAVLVAGRLVQTDLTVVDETKFMFTLTDMNDVNHLVVFMTGQQAFPQNVGGSVYISWPSESGDSVWQLIGHLTNEKPSAIFKISGLKKGSTTSPMLSFPGQRSNQVQLGISFESLSEISQQVPSIQNSEQASSYVEFTTSMLQNFYNFSSSFAKPLEEIVQIASACDQSVAKTQFIPVTVLENWMKQFESKLSRDVNFWKK